MQDHVTLWNKCLELIKQNLSETEFDTWFKPIVSVSFNGKILVLGVPSNFYIECIEGKYPKVFKTSLIQTYGKGVILNYTTAIVKGEPDTVVNIAPRDVSQTIIKERQEASYQDPFTQPEIREELDSQLNPSFTFENYYDGTSNRFALNIAETIAKTPDGRHFNPLLIFGPTGVGKTHLMQAIGIKIKEQQPKMRVLYVTERIFETQYGVATVNNKVPDFINFYQSIDVLLMDDIQELAGKKGTQTAFYHIFNHLRQNSRHIIMSCDRPPASLDGVMPRLMGRFKSGVMAEMDLPDIELRRIVLRKKAAEEGLDMPEDVIEYIATHVTDSIREVEGVMMSLIARAVVMNQKISLDMARVAVSHAVKAVKHVTNFEEIAEIVCSHLEVDIDSIYGKSRKREIVEARQIIMYLAKTVTKMSSTNIGIKLGRDHATVLHAEKSIKQRISVDKAFRTTIDTIQSKLGK